MAENNVELEHGTRDEHIATLKIAKAAGVRSVWSGDIRRNRYLAENLEFGVREKIIEITAYDDASAQESGYRIKWLKHAEV